MASTSPDVVALMEPDVWFAPAVVAEVRGAEVSRSPIHTCAKTPQGGLAVRFPRFVRWRDDKGPSQATTSGEVEAMFRLQRPQS